MKVKIQKLIFPLIDKMLHSLTLKLKAEEKRTRMWIQDYND